MGLCPWYGLWPNKYWAKPEPGAQPKDHLRTHGEAQPRLTSAGEAAVENNFCGIAASDSQEEAGVLQQVPKSIKSGDFDSVCALSAAMFYRKCSLASTRYGFNNVRRTRRWSNRSCTHDTDFTDQSFVATPCLMVQQRAETKRHGRCSSGCAVQTEVLP